MSLKLFLSCSTGGLFSEGILHLCEVDDFLKLLGTNSKDAHELLLFSNLHPTDSPERYRKFLMLFVCIPTFIQALTDDFGW
jgi:hypothetical protein